MLACHALRGLLVAFEQSVHEVLHLHRPLLGDLPNTRSQVVFVGIHLIFDLLQLLQLSLTSFRFILEDDQVVRKTLNQLDDDIFLVGDLHEALTG